MLKTKSFLTFTRSLYTSRVCSGINSYVAKNEPVLKYLKGSEERRLLEEKLKEYDSQTFQVPIIIGEEEYVTKETRYQVKPHDHASKLARFSHADSELIQKAIQVSLDARKDWEATPIQERCEIFLRAGDLVAGKYRMDLMASTMLGQAKTIIQGEIDCACELADFYRFNVQYALDMLNWKCVNTSESVNTIRYRGLEGFWAAIAPFNFTAISGHLVGAAALMGNVVLWKTSDTSLLSSYIIFKILREAGVPPGVISFLPCNGRVFGDTVCVSPDLAGINFTGSTGTFRHLWRQVGENISTYNQYPRLIGECGGKNYHFVHKSADIDSVVYGTIRSAFEYGGQKCSACSRLYVPKSRWMEIREGLLNVVKKLKLGSPRDHDTFMSAVIDADAYKRITDYIVYGKEHHDLIAGGGHDDSKGYFVEPTIFQVRDHHDRLMSEEIFGPILSVYVYPDDDYKQVLGFIDNTSPFALTGSVYAQDQAVLDECLETLKYSAGNFYINDKSTGAVVAQQPFSGSRLSGTNDKAGSPMYLMKFVSPQAIKTTHVPLRAWSYPYMDEK